MFITENENYNIALKEEEEHLPFSSQLPSLKMSRSARYKERLRNLLGDFFVFSISSLSILAIIFIFIFIIKDALPFFLHNNIKEFFTSTRWFPSAAESEFGALSLFYGSFVVTLAAMLISVPLGIFAAVCLSDILPFKARQLIKPIIEMLAAIPSVAYGFFALVIFAPLLQQKGGILLSSGVWIFGIPVGLAIAIVAGDFLSHKIPANNQKIYFWVLFLTIFGLTLLFCNHFSNKLLKIHISSGTNALNVAIILAIMAIPTIVSVSEDALQATGRDLREGSYALGATKMETITRVVIPAAASGILAAIILGTMRAMGETMVVWMASGNAAQIPNPWYNLLEPVRTLTATIAGDMGEADQVTGSARYHVLFALATCLFLFSFVCNIISEKLVVRKKL
jgi:phosphate transport system permease protein